MVDNGILNRLLFGQPEEFLVEDAEEDKNIIRITVRVELTDTAGHEADAELSFNADCRCNEEFYFWMKNYPVKTLGYGKWGERVLR